METQEDQVEVDLFIVCQAQQFLHPQVQEIFLLQVHLLLLFKDIQEELMLRVQMDLQVVVVQVQLEEQMLLRVQLVLVELD